MNSSYKCRFRASTLLVQVVLFLGVALADRAATPDSVITTMVEPGVTHLSIIREGPNTVNVLIVDLKAKNLKIESYRPVGLVPTTVQVSRNDREGHRVLGGVNADFFSFSTGWPVSNQVLNCQFVLGISSVRSHVLVDDDGKVQFEKLSFDGWFKSKDGKVHQINGVNDAHRNSSVVLHNSFSDTATMRVGPGKVIPLRLLSAEWSVGDTLKLLAGRDAPADLMHIAPREAALWFGSAPSVWEAREGVQPGDTILVYLGFQPARRGVVTVIGGAGMIVSDGTFVEDSINMKERMSFAFFRARHPRTFVGIDRDTTRLFLCTVDGRQATSVGMNYREMADLLLGLGAWHATNLDGGGSTTMVLRGKIVNSPSDKTGERPVANTLQVVKVGPSKSGR